ncbi:deaminase [Neisseria sp. Ec49-e6-T10]|uniref:deaminase n=1 Tax=Neisseria sp. Ec49-e6-T10 TaxID=3140744 RepID=UPI003EC02133
MVQEKTQINSIVLSTPPLPPKVVAQLASWHIHTVQDLMDMGVVKAFLLLKQAGLTLTFSTLWSLESITTGIPVQQISIEKKNSLKNLVKQALPVAVFPEQNTLEHYMKCALEEAKKAFGIQEVPVGCIVVKDGQIIGSGFNHCMAKNSVMQHAELVAMTQAMAFLNHCRLENCDLYVTLEPCAMCAGAILQARVKRVVFGAREPQMGAAGSVVNLFASSKLNTHTAILGGVLAQESQNLLQTFFQNRRE